jgi:flagellar hook-basal body complex protein FliE
MAGPAQNIQSAISAYNQTLTSGGSKGVQARDSGEDGGEFADLVKGAIKEAIEIGKKSETLSIAAVQDKADLNQVVTAVAEAEVTLQTVVAVRDKLIDAYKEIMRMPM